MNTILSDNSLCRDYFVMGDKNRIFTVVLFVAVFSLMISFSNQNAFAACSDPPAPGVDWSGCDKSGEDLPIADLSNADLSGADLSNINLIGANLTNADLTNPDLTDADLSNVDLTDANLTDADLIGTFLSIANFSNANFSNADLTDADLAFSNLSGANLTNANLTNADLTDANLHCYNHPVCIADDDGDLVHVDTDPDDSDPCNPDENDPLCVPLVCTPPPSGMVSWWPLDETSGIISDDIQGANDGTHVNGPTPVSGKVDGALSFDGVDDFVEVADSDDLSFTDGSDNDKPFSIDAWINMDDATLFRTVTKYISSADGQEYQFDTDSSDRLRICLIDNSAHTLICRAKSAAITGEEGNWIHVAATYDGSETTAGLKLYQDGVRVDDSDSATAGTYSGMENSNTSLTIGRLTEGATTYFADGLIDEVEIFDRALSQTEIQDIYNAGSAGKCKIPPNNSPVCTDATPSSDSLWPPNHKFVDITVNGVTDADGDDVTIEVTGITQDEPTNGLGEGDQSPDGTGVGTDTTSVRAERSGLDDGRVYEISFTADDGNGGMCSGSVLVGVPHDKKDTAVDSGDRFDST